MTRAPQLLLVPLVAALGARQEVAVDDGEVDGLSGALRHVQLLEVTVNQPHIVRFATSTVAGVAVHERRLGDRRPLGEPDAMLPTQFDALPMWSWSHRAPWQILESDEESWLVALDEESGTVDLRTFPGGEEVARVPHASSFESARLRDGSIEVLLRNGEEVDLVAIDPAARTVARTTLVDLDLPFAAACFVESGPRSDVPRSAFVVTYEDTELVTYRLDLAEGGVQRVPTGVIGGGRALRLVARRSGKLDLVAIGTPMFDGDWGRVVVVSIGAGGRVGDSRLLHPLGQPDDGMPGVEWTMQYGQALAFTADADEDGHPDLAVGASYGPSEHVDIVSWVSGASLARVTSRSEFGRHRIGSSVSASPCGRYVLSAGGQASYPEVFRTSGAALLLDLERDGDPVVTSFVAPGR